MERRGLRFGFVSTYEQTVFLKIGRENDGQLALFYSEPIEHTENVVESSNSGQKVLENISVCLGIFYLFHRISADDASKWSFDIDSQRSSTWTMRRKYMIQGTQAQDYHSPNAPANIFENSVSGDEDTEPESPSISLSSKLAQLDIRSRDLHAEGALTVFGRSQRGPSGPTTRSKSRDMP